MTRDRYCQISKNIRWSSNSTNKELKLKKFYKIENQIMTSNNSIQLCKLESIGNEKKAYVIFAKN